MDRRFYERFYHENYNTIQIYHIRITILCNFKKGSKIYGKQKLKNFVSAIENYYRYFFFILNTLEEKQKNGSEKWKFYLDKEFTFYKKKIV